MRYLRPFFTIFMVILLTSCSWWPFGGGARNTGNCLDDDSCEGANPFEEQLVGGTWYCYGKTKDEPWDCSQTEDGTKIHAVSQQPPPASVAAADNAEPFVADDTELEATSKVRAEMTFDEAEISSGSGSTASLDAMTAQPIGNFLDEFDDDAWAVQLIALQSSEEVESFVRDHNLQDPKYVEIESGGANWYVLILDVFTDRSSADSAAAVWETENEPSSRPWVRPVSSLKAAARRAES